MCNYTRKSVAWKELNEILDVANIWQIRSSNFTLFDFKEKKGEKEESTAKRDKVTSVTVVFITSIFFIPNKTLEAANKFRGNYNYKITLLVYAVFV